MERYNLEMSITLRAPLLTESTGAMRFGLDAAQLKKNGLPVLSSALVRGNIRHALTYFTEFREASQAGLTPEKINRWFGQPSKRGTEWLPERALLDFGYHFELDAGSVEKLQTEKPEYRHRIRIDKETDTVAKGALQIIESCFKTGDEITFTGTIRGHFRSKEEVDDVTRWLNKAGMYIPALGAQKGIGFGQVIKVTCKPSEVTSSKVEALPEQDRFGVSLKPDRPFCIAQPHVSDSNRFVSEEYISGAVVKASIAQALLQDTRDRNDERQNAFLENIAFDKWTVSHAIAAPEGDAVRPESIPLSMVYANGQFHDVAHLEMPQLIDGDLPAFETDWKSEVRDKLALGQSGENGLRIAPRAETTHRRILDVHTSIVPLYETRQAGLSKEAHLFSVESIDPVDDAWLADIDLSALNPQQLQAARTALAKVLSEPLNKVGKTKASLNATLSAHPFRESVVDTTQWQRVQKSGCLALKLNTDACILPTTMYQVPQTNGSEELNKLYTEYWDYASEGLLKLSHFYAGQRKVGGVYLHQRFFEEQQYTSYWLTEPGSVFVLYFEPARCAEVYSFLRKWLCRGIPPWHEMSLDWRANPWLPQNGFGEVAIHSLQDAAMDTQGVGDE